MRKMTLITFLFVITIICLPIFSVASCTSWPKGEGWTKLELNTKGSLSNVVISPTNPNTVYAAVEDKSISELLLSDNNGQTWQKISDFYGSNLEFDPVDPYSAYAHSWEGLKKTADGGNTWNVVLPMTTFRDATIFAISPSNPDVLYVGGYLGVYKTANGCQTWTDVSNGIDVGSNGVLALTIDPSDSDVVFAGSNVGLFKTIDGGNHWFRTESGMEGSKYIVVTNIIIDPKSPSIVYVNVNGVVLKSIDSGSSWQQTHFYDNETKLPIQIVNWIISPDGGTIYALDFRNDVYRYSTETDQASIIGEFGAIGNSGAHKPCCLATSSGQSQFIYVGTDVALYRYTK